MSAAPWAVTKPKLIVVVVIDQFRADYLSRYQSLFGKNGFNALIRDGAYFPYGEYDVLQAMTGPGHATVLSGAYPYQMGIPLNDWYDQKTRAPIYCVEDPSVKTIDAASMQSGSSPKNLVGTTVGDELKNADQPAKVISLALKDRAAVLLGGHRADLAMWLDFDRRQWTSSTYYRKDGTLPAWMIALNAKIRGRAKCQLNQACGVELTTEAFKAALEGEALGQSKTNDLVAVSFSSHDFVGHHFGPNSEEIKALTILEDKALAEMRALVQAKVPGGLKNAVFVLTGDHGVAPTPEYLAATGVDSAHISEDAIVKEINAALNKRYGVPKKGNWIAQVLDFNFFVDEQNVTDAKADLMQMEYDIKEIVMKVPGIAHVFTRGEYDARRLPPGVFDRKVSRTYYRGRSGHVVAVLKPFFINGSQKDANHMTGYTYDRTVPILFSGFGIKNGLFADKAEVVDIAPTLSFLLGILPPALSEGHVLAQILKTSTSGTR